MEKKTKTKSRVWMKMKLRAESGDEDDCEGGSEEKEDKGNDHDQDPESTPLVVQRSMLVMWGGGLYALNRRFGFNISSNSSSTELQGSNSVGTYFCLEKNATFKPSESDCQIRLRSNSNTLNATAILSSLATSPFSFMPSLSFSTKGFDIPSLDLIIGSMSSVLLYPIYPVKFASDCESM
ncbi:hypothetical protein J1N35_013682 [Gossypium stocksii]|uniref:Uncharacterized protein n=1 Tax=Gossypium stocksii TaxID=47602 RepID=A0A9D3VUB7_9ROSI|nr:hypothetical protein J1N35_013682 [Gossypium stocksii]